MVGSDRYIGGMIDMGSGHLHPLNLALGEARAAASLGVSLFEHSKGDPHRLRRAGRGDHGPRPGQRGLPGDRLQRLPYLGDLQPDLGGKVLPAGSYILATQVLEKRLRQRLLPQNMAVCDQNVALDYYRLSADGRLLFGGACNYSGRDPRDIKAFMLPKLLRVFPELAGTAIEFQWGHDRHRRQPAAPDRPPRAASQRLLCPGLFGPWPQCHPHGGQAGGGGDQGESRGFDLFSRVPT